MQITEATSQKIKNMSLLCAAFVVMIHMGLPDGRETSTWLADQILRSGICQIAVPFFFVVSGFFLAAHFNETGWWGHEVKKRLSTLVIPFYFWNLIFLVTSVLLNITIDLLANQPLGKDFCFWKNQTYLQILGLDFANPPLLHPLWYVRCLFLFVILSPFTCKLITKFKMYWLVICFIAATLQGHIPISCSYMFFCVGFSLIGLIYFSIGIFLQQHKLPNTENRIPWIALFIGVLLLTIKTFFFYKAWPFQFVVIQIAVPFMLLAVWHFMPATKLPNWLTACSFPIYLMHVLFFPYVGFVLQKLNPTQVSPILRPTINFLVGFFGSILVATLLRKYLPKTAKVLFGGR